jgi:hypothetical protein
MNIEALARIGYEAYGKKADWKAYDGKPMPQWHELPQHIRDKWMAATEAILDTAVKAAMA